MTCQSLAKDTGPGSSALCRRGQSSPASGGELWVQTSQGEARVSGEAHRSCEGAPWGSGKCPTVFVTSASEFVSRWQKTVW